MPCKYNVVSKDFQSNLNFHYFMIMLIRACAVTVTYIIFDARCNHVNGKDKDVSETQLRIFDSVS